MTYFKIQLARYTDAFSPTGPDGELTELTKLPLPFFAAEKDGRIARQDVWMGTMVRVVGFVADLDRQEVDLFWAAAVKDPAKVVGMYLVTADENNDMVTHLTAVDSFDPVADSE